MCFPWELNPQPFALLTQCSTTEPQEQLQTVSQTTTIYYFTEHFELKHPTDILVWLSLIAHVHLRDVYLMSAFTSARHIFLSVCSSVSFKMSNRRLLDVFKMFMM